MKINRKDFVDGSLVSIRNKLGSGSAAEEKKTEGPETGAAGPATRKREYRPPLTDVYSDALEKRRDEFRMLRRDLCENLTERIAEMPEEIHVAEEQLEELKETLEVFTAKLDELRGIDENAWESAKEGSELGVAMRKAENARLEYIRCSAKLTALRRENPVGDTSSREAQGRVEDLHSLSFSQLFKMGFCFSLPIIIGILAASVILAFAIFAAMR